MAGRIQASITYNGFEYSVHLRRQKTPGSYPENHLVQRILRVKKNKSETMVAVLDHRAKSASKAVRQAHRHILYGVIRIKNHNFLMQRVSTEGDYRPIFILSSKKYSGIMRLSYNTLGRCTRIILWSKKSKKVVYIHKDIENDYSSFISLFSLKHIEGCIGDCTKNLDPLSRQLILRISYKLSDTCIHRNIRRYNGGIHEHTYIPHIAANEYIQDFNYGIMKLSQQ